MSQEDNLQQQENHNMFDLIVSTPKSVKNVVDWHEETAILPAEPMAYQAALSVLSLPLQRFFRTHDDAPLSLFLLNVANSGDGKEHGRRILQAAAHQFGMGKKIVNGYRSDSGVFWKLIEEPSHIASIDEFGKYLKAAISAKGYSEAALRQMMMFFNASRGTVHMDAYSRRGKTHEEMREAAELECVVSPTLGIYGTSTVKAFFSCLTSEHIEDGFLNRFLICNPNLQPRAPRMSGAIANIHASCPTSLGSWQAQIMRRVHQEIPSGQEIDEFGQYKAIRVHPDGESLEWIDEFTQALVDKRRKLGGLSSIIYARTLEKAQRLAAVVGLAEDPWVTHIPLYVTQWAYLYVYRCDEAMARLVEEELSDSKHEANVNKVLKALKRKGGQMTRSELISTVRSLNAKELNEVIEHLVQSDMVVMAQRPPVEGSGRPLIIYTLKA